MWEIFIVIGILSTGFAITITMIDTIRFYKWKWKNNKYDSHGFFKEKEDIKND